MPRSDRDASRRRLHPPYVTDSHYATPHSLTVDEDALREAIVQRDKNKVETLLTEFVTRSPPLVLSGGVLDVAIHGKWTVSAEKRHTVSACVSPLLPAVSTPVEVVAAASAHIRTLSALSAVSVPSSDEDEMVEMGASSRRPAKTALLRRVSSATTYDVHHSASASLNIYSNSNNINNQSTARCRPEGIAVPASSLPGRSPPSMLRDDPPRPSATRWRPNATQAYNNFGVVVTSPVTVNVNDASDSAGGASSPCSPTGCLLLTLLKYPYYDTNYCGPCSVAVQENDLECLRLLLSDHRFDPNIGCPLRKAILANNMTMFDELMRCERINPNRGAPLIYAVYLGNLNAVRALVEHPVTQVNRYVTGTSSTPLTAAIRCCAAEEQQNISSSSSSIVCYSRSAVFEGALDLSSVTERVPVARSVRYDIVRTLLMCFRVDVNKGFALTPLQMAVLQGDAELVRLILSKANVAPNREIGKYPAPLQIAVDNDSVELVKLLLTDPRTYVTEALVNDLEAQNNVPVLQLIFSLSHGDIRIGFLWSMRCLVIVLLATLLWGEMIADIALILSAATHQCQGIAFATLALNTLTSMCIAATMARRYTSYSSIPWYYGALPMLPAPETAMAVHVGRWLLAEVHDLYSRQRLFELFYAVGLLRCVLGCLPLVLIRISIVLHGPRALRGVSAVGIMFGVMACACGVAIRLLRIPKDIDDQKEQRNNNNNSNRNGRSTNSSSFHMFQIV